VKLKKPIVIEAATRPYPRALTHVMDWLRGPSKAFA